MKKFIPICLISASFALTFLASLNPLSSRFALNGTHFDKTPFDPQHKITVNAHAFTGNESKQFLSHNLVRRKVIPIRISLQNNTANEYSLCASSIDLPHIDPKKVAFKVSKTAIPRLIAWRIASFFFWPLMIPGTIDSMITYKHYRELKKDYNAKSLKEEGEILVPYATFHRVLFVPKAEIKENFQVTLIDIETLASTTLEVQLSPEN